MKNTVIKREDLSPKIKEALERAKKRLIVETKALNSYIVSSDKKGGIKKTYAKDL
jgi:hypothetical protein